MEKLITRILVGFGFFSFGYCHFLHMYCGSTDCYKLLGVSRKATKTELQHAYTTLQTKFKERDAEQILDKFRNAYMILSNNDTRKHYDYMLANPNHMMYNYYQYFKFSVSPTVTVQVLLVLGIVIISLAQYFYRKHSYWSAVRDALKNPKNRSKALHKVQEQHILYETSKNLTIKEKKEQRKKEEDRALRQIVQQSVKYRRPRLQDTLFIQLLFSPYFFLQHMKRVIDQLARFDFFKEEYEDLATYKKSQGLKVEPWTDPSKNIDLDECEDSQTKTNAWIKNHIE